MHGIDGQLMDKLNFSMDWSIGIHDAILVHPCDATSVRSKTVECMKDIHTNRNSILNNYFSSLGIKKNYMWLEIMKLTDSRDDVNITANVLK